MYRDSDVEAAIDLLSSRGTIRCKAMEQLLIGLGFIVREGKKQGHRVITHPRLNSFSSAAFSCGHGRNSAVKPAYVRHIRKVLESHAEELKKLLGDRK